jgi:hypothetical protein
MRSGPEFTPLPAPQGLSISVVSSLTLLPQDRDGAPLLDEVDPELAVKLACVLVAGVTADLLRWLLYHGYAAHLVEVPHHSAEKRSFQPGNPLDLGCGPCLALTARGVELLLGIAFPSSARKPSWDRDRRELRFGSVVVKRFTQPAGVQETILTSFEEEGWSERIDDPLRPCPEQDAPSRLRSAVNNLNRGLPRSVFRFGVCGSGTAVYWRETGPVGGREGGASGERVLEKARGCIEMPPFLTARPPIADAGSTAPAASTDAAPR